MLLEELDGLGGRVRLGLGVYLVLGVAADRKAVVGARVDAELCRRFYFSIFFFPAQSEPR